MKADAITLTINMSFAAERIDQAIQLLVSVGGRVEAKSGCQTFLVSRDAVNADRIDYKEAWATETAFRRHLQSEEFQRVLITMDMCNEEPQVAVGNFSGHTGLLYLQQLCGRQEADETWDVP